MSDDPTTESNLLDPDFDNEVVEHSNMDTISVVDFEPGHNELSMYGEDAVLLSIDNDGLITIKSPDEDIIAVFNTTEQTFQIGEVFEDNLDDAAQEFWDQLTLIAEKAQDLIK